jgi:hypothetical protein
MQPHAQIIACATPKVRCGGVSEVLAQWDSYGRSLSRLAGLDAAAGDAVVDRADEAGGPDNITVVLYQHGIQGSGQHLCGHQPL